MQRLAESVQDVVGDVDNVVDGPQTYGFEALAQPLGAFGHFHAAHRHSGIARAGFPGFHLDAYRPVVVGLSGSEVIDRGARKTCGSRMHSHPCIEVARHAIVRGGVDAVGRQVHFEHIVVVHAEIFGGGGAGGGSALGQYDDAVVARAGAYLIFGTDHAERFHAADFGFLDFELLVAVVERGAHRGHHHGLARGHIGRAAHYLLWCVAAQVHRGDVQVVAVGMFHASEHLAYYDAAKAATDVFHAFHAACFKADGRESRSHLLGRHPGGQVDIFFKPLI